MCDVCDGKKCRRGQDYFVREQEYSRADIIRARTHGVVGQNAMSANKNKVGERNK